MRRVVGDERLRDRRCRPQPEATVGVLARAQQRDDGGLVIRRCAIRTTAARRVGQLGALRRDQRRERAADQLLGAGMLEIGEPRRQATHQHQRR